MRHFIKTLIHKDGLIGCEVGVYFGDHAKMMIDVLNLEELHLVDKYWQDNNPFLDARTKIPHDEKYVWHIGWSVDVARSIKDEYFDFIYIDGDHSYESVSSDIKAWWPKLKEGGFMAGHDWLIQPVQKAVEDFVKKYKITDLKYLNDPDGKHEDWYFTK